jgi:hypothetical protein
MTFLEWHSHYEKNSQETSTKYSRNSETFTNHWSLHQTWEMLLWNYRSSLSKIYFTSQKMQMNSLYIIIVMNWSEFKTSETAVLSRLQQLLLMLYSQIFCIIQSLIQQLCITNSQWFQWTWDINDLLDLENCIY